MKKILAIFLSLTLLLSLCGCRLASGAVNAFSQDPTVLLFAGLDDAAENTDVLCLLSVDAERERLAVLQIPRDTYFKEGAGERINGIYASARFAGASEKEALSALSSQIEKCFGVSLSGTVAMKSAALCATVDALGGVDVSLPFSITVEGKEYAAGTHHLSGAEAEAFIRYREGYLTGDLGRVDAQKIFLCAFLSRARQSLRPAELIRMLFSMRGDVITDLSLSRALSVGLSVHARLPYLSASFATLPGEPLLSSGHWYYIVNRAGAVALLSEYFSPAREFDSERKLLDEENAEQANIYNDRNLTYRVYTEENLSSIRIPTKKE